MEHGHPLFSPKLMVMVGKALDDLLLANRANFRDLMDAYELPHLFEDNDLRPIELEPEDYVRELAKGDPNLHAVRLVEAIHEEVTTANPAVLTITNKTTIRGHPRATTRVPPSFIRLTRQVQIEGFTFRNNRLVPIDSEAPQEYQDKTELAARLRSHNELDPNTLIHHMEQSDSTLDNGNWHAAANEARSFFEGLSNNIAKSEAQQRDEEIPNLPKPGQRRSEFGPCRKYLNQISFTTPEEDEAIAAFFSFLSVEGGHPRVTEEHMAKLTRRICWVFAAHLLTIYESEIGSAG